MELIRIGTSEFNILSIYQHNNLLNIRFPTKVTLAEKDLSIIELYTAGRVLCATLTGYDTIYNGDGTTDIILSNNGSVYTEPIEPIEPDPVEPYNPTEDELLERAQQSKFAEVSRVCQSTIYSGTDITTSKGTQHYSLTLEDQTNISYAKNAIQNGATEFPYHADGELCTMYSATDINTIADKATEFKLYHTTYCNHLNIWIKRCTTRDEVAAIYYGIQLPTDLQANFIAIVGEQR